MSLSLPGYYYDEVKKKYFKIENSHSAPASAAWSATNVKRRKTEGQRAAFRHERAESIKRHVKRARVLREPLLGGFLNRELGIGGPDADVPAAAWVAGLNSHSHVKFVTESRKRREPNLGCFWIGGEDERTGLGVAYSSLWYKQSHSSVLSSYVPTDYSNTLSHSVSHPRLGDMIYEEPVDCSQVSSINYHKPSHRMIVTAREPSLDPGVYLFSPQLSSPQENKPTWELGAQPRNNRCKSIRLRPGRRYYSVNLATPAPAASSDLICTLATDDGIIRLTSNEGISWITPRPEENRQQDTRPMDVLAQAFHATNPSVLYAGTRSSTVQTIDLRTPPGSWTSFQTVSAVTHLRSLESNPNNLLVAALRSTLHIYDLRYITTEAPDSQPQPPAPPPQRRRHRNGRRIPQPPAPPAPVAARSSGPVLTFPDYCNEAHIHIGLDTNFDAGVLAAAHDDGRVALYSLRSGLRLRAPTVDRWTSETPVRSLMFRTMPRDRHASLWVGGPGVLEGFSMGVQGGEDEG
ncbi:hypothetical protein ACHAQA_000238 [Verticillium albo-atrum]